MGYKLAKQVRASWSHLDNGPYRLLLEIALELPETSRRCFYGRDRYAEFLGKFPRTKAEEAAVYKSVKRHIASLVSAGALTLVDAGYSGHNSVYQINLPEQVGGHSLTPNKGDSDRTPSEIRGTVSGNLGDGERQEGGHSPAEWGTVTVPPKKDEEVREEEIKNSLPQVMFSPAVAAEIVDDEEEIIDDPQIVVEHFCREVQKLGITPKPTGRWRASAAQLLTEHSAEDIGRVIDYALADSFWKSRVLELPKLAKHFDQLKVKADSKPFDPWTDSHGNSRRAQQAIQAGIELERMVAGGAYQPKTTIATGNQRAMEGLRIAAMYEQIEANAKEAS